MVNYRDLLVKYINHVTNQIGASYISKTILANDFDDEEVLMLELLDLEALTLWENKNLIKEEK